MNNIDSVNMPIRTFSQVSQLMEQTKSMIQMLEDVWFATRDEYGVTEEQMKVLMEYNTSMIEAHPDDEMIVEHEEGDNTQYGLMRGLKYITEERVREIFGEDTRMVGVEMSLTMDNLFHTLDLFIALTRAYKDYSDLKKEIADAIKDQEEESLAALQKVVDEATDPEKKEKAQKALDRYYETKYIDFLYDLGMEDKKFIVKAFLNASSIDYALKRSRDYMKKLNIPEKFILEISSFEKRYLDERYHKQSNILLLQFLHMLVYHPIMSSATDKQRAVAFVVALDKLIRKEFNEVERERVMENIVKFEDIFLDDIPDKIEPVEL